MKRFNEFVPTYAQDPTLKVRIYLDPHTTLLFILQDPLCPSNPFPPSPPGLLGSDACANDIECQEAFGVDYECYKEKCIIRGCRADADCSGGERHCCQPAENS
jgi:hypothetical protein